MKTPWLTFEVCVLALCLMLTSCVTQPPCDYANFREHPPRSILVLPPLNESTAVEGTYGFLSTVTYPLAEMGYYVYPVAVVDHFLKENGMPTAGEMHQIPSDKIREIIGADAVLYLTLKEYGTRYAVFCCVITVAVEGKLVDTRTGLVLWEGKAKQQQTPGGHPLLVAALQVVSSSLDLSHGLCRTVNTNLFMSDTHGLLYGPYHPKSEGQ